MSDDIPKIIHRVWTGTEQVPQPVLDNWKFWERCYPDLDYRYWTDSTIVSLRAYTVLSELPKFQDPRIKADYVRLAVLIELGGLYVDSDAVPLEPSIDYVFGEPWIAGHRTKFYKKGPRILNGAICASPVHPFLMKVFASAVLEARSGKINAHKLAGPHLYMDLYDSSIRILPLFDILYEAAAKKGNLEYLRSASPYAPFVFIGE